MKQLTDEVFAQVQEALRPFAEDAKYIHKDWSDERMRASLTQNTPLTVRHFRKALEALAALAALDTTQPVCGYDDTTGNCTRVNCCKQAQPEQLTDSYVQTMPDKCDRIVWRNKYYHLPLKESK